MYSLPTSIPRISIVDPHGGSDDLPNTSELYAKGAALDSVQSFCRKMLPVANLDDELEALGADGVAGSGTSPF